MDIARNSVTGKKGLILLFYAPVILKQILVQRETIFCDNLHHDLCTGLFGMTGFRKTILMASADIYVHYKGTRYFFV